MISTTLSLLLVVIATAAFLLGRRNNNVTHFRHSLLFRIYTRNMRDISSGKSVSEWRYDHFFTVSHDDMVFRFWKPLTPEAWWDDTRFLGDQ